MLWDYYYKTGEKPNPLVSYILLGILVVVLISVWIFNRKRDKKKGRF